MIYLEERTSHFHLGIWKIEESKDELLSLLGDMPFIEKDVLLLRSQSKILERLAVRVLLRSMLNKAVEIGYETTGKPYLNGLSLNISISHTKGYVAVLLSDKHRRGIDIQYVTDKVKRVKSRFVSNEEYISEVNNLTHLLLFWSAKETLYKAMGGGVNLKDSFRVLRFEPQSDGIIQVVEKITPQEELFNLAYKVTSDFVLTYTL